MTKVQNKSIHKNIVFLFFIFLVMHVQIFAQNITIEHEVSMLALGDSYTIGESVDLNERWPHQLVSELRQLGLDIRDPDYFATTGWTTSDLLEGIGSGLDRD